MEFGGFYSGLRRNRGQVTEVVIFAAIGDRFQVFGVTPVGDADTGDLALFCHIHSLLLFHNRIVRKLIPGDSAALFYKSDDSLRIGICLWDLIQYLRGLLSIKWIPYCLNLKLSSD